MRAGWEVVLIFTRFVKVMGGTDWYCEQLCSGSVLLAKSCY